ncbi:transcription termination factor Rho [Mycolicibacter arupensis]|uniref:Transcription termination factor Rho n=1 Tax=Mycolicibacter arupensis TaxID=342002 RepID=A0A0F5MZC7_9MYCO|nr:transcription termination factor Rho [Mycolicibacter arupensis]KKC00057.1 transcription termination factor Rho [Mycolicibacter arupensis]MCV7274990.1 transcription termination factor Rho [Mycolicibacter arupensis]OQZ95683.1 transcription termination factor Rho [Mycolicibacter arupensis]
MTETDLFAAEGSTDQESLSTPPSTPETSTDVAAGGSDAAPSAPEEATPAPVVTESAPAPAPDNGAAATDAALSSMVLPELRALANRVGVKGSSGMRKSELIAAIREVNSGGSDAPAAQPAAEPATNGATNGAETAQADASEAQGAPRRRERRGASRSTGAPAANGAESDKSAESDKAAGQDNPAEDAPQGESGKQDRAEDKAEKTDKADKAEKAEKADKGEQSGGRRERDGAKNDGKADESAQSKNDDQGGEQGNRGGDDDEGRGGRRGRRFRDRRRRGERGGEGGGAGGDAELREDDVVQPVAGILDVLDNYAFVRTSGYLAGPNDVYVSMNMVRKNGLRRGDAVTGAVRVARDGDQPNQRQKFNPLVRLDSVNGGPVEEARNRPDFTKLTPLYPNQRLRLETSGDKLTTRVIDLIMPIGKGQRALIVSPPKAGKTTIMQDIANAITRNNPECHLMVVLVDERPEEVTDMQRSVKGEVIASTFDRPPSDHTQAAELAIERAKRLVEQGKDVVVLLDSITRLGRAYNNASPASGRILSGGVDSTALYPPKRFLGAARNIENGGSLTIIATAMVETGSTGDTVIFEEFKGTGNAELKLDRKIAERRVFPAVDVNPSGTRKDELLLSPDEFAIVHKLRRLLSGLDSHQAIDLLMSQLRKTKNNYEFLVQVSKTTPGMDND